MKKNAYILQFAKIVLVLFVFAWIISKTLDLYSTEELVVYQNQVFSAKKNMFWLILAFLLMPLNWYLEAQKWRLSLKPIFKISIQKALTSVMAGVALGIFTPNRIGEFAGKVLTIPSKYRTKGIYANVICSISQLTTTLVFGLIILIIRLPDFIVTEHNEYVTIFRIVLVILILLLLLFYFRSNLLIKYFTGLKWMNKLLPSKYLSNNISKSSLIPIIQRSTLRYIIFTTQFTALLWFFQIDITVIEAVLYLPLIYLFLAILPTIALSELGIREGVAIFVLSSLSDNQLGIISASFALWVINISIPALMGCFFIIKQRLNRI